MSKERLHELLYVDPSGGPELKVIDVFICKLRRKVTDLGILIETVWGQGYRLDPGSISLLWPDHRAAADTQAAA